MVMTSDQVRALTPAEIVRHLRVAAECERNNKAITWEHGWDLVTICAVHGDMLADALELAELFANLYPNANSAELRAILGLPVA